MATKGPGRPRRQSGDDGATAAVRKRAARPGAVRRRASGRRLGDASLADQVHDWLSAQITNGALRPGTPLNELSIVEQVGASRTPVREAIRRLQHDGLVRIVRGRGAFVADVTEREVREIYLCRMYLEGLSARLAAEQMTPEALHEFRALLAEMESAVERDDLGSFFRANVAFTRRKGELADNGTLAMLLESLGLRVMRLRYLSMGLPSRMATSFRLHREIVEAFERRDGDAAERLDRELIEGAGQAILRYHFGVTEQSTGHDLTGIADLLRPPSAATP